MRVQVQHQPSYILHQRPYREQGRLLDILTPEYGRVRLVVAGLGRRGGRRGLLFQSFYPLVMSYTGRMGGLQRLTAVEPRSAAVLRLSGQALWCGLYVNELVTRVLPEGIVAEDVFLAYEQVLQGLTTPPSAGLEAVLRRFELQLLAALGYALAFVEADSFGPAAALCPEREYVYEPDRGFVLPAMVSAGTAPSACFSGAELLAIARGDWQARQTRQAGKRLLRMALGRVLGAKPLQARKLFLR